MTGKLGDGIATIATTGDIKIGTVKTNGEISGTYDGICATTAGAGSISIKVGDNVTGVLSDGIWINSATTSATNQIDILALAVVVGNSTTGVGIATATAGAMTINDVGAITTLADDSSATTQGGTALWNSLGATTVNNNCDGTIIGGLQVST